MSGALILVVCVVCRDGACGVTIQGVGSDYDYLFLRHRTGFDGPNRLVATELEANPKSFIPSIVTVHILLLVSYCEDVQQFGEWRSSKALYGCSPV